MRNLAFWIFVALCTNAMSQQQSNQQQGGPEREPVTTLKVAVRRVVVDVTVTDNQGKPVRGLTKDDFTVFENGAPQTVRSFEAQTLETLSGPTSAAIKLPPNTFANLSAGQQGGPPTVILYDLLNTPRDAQGYAHEQLLKFLRDRRTKTQVAIFVLTDRLHMLQGFTDDDAKLIAALNQKSARGYRSAHLQQNGEESAQSTQLSGTEGNSNAAAAQQDAAFQQISAMLQHMETQETSFRLDQRIQLTSDALQDIAKFLISMPGRKNLLWLSGSFPSNVLPDPGLDSRDIAQVSRNYSKFTSDSANLLAVSHVAVYPIDVRGLQVNPVFSGASTATFEPGQGKDIKSNQNFAAQQAAEHATMEKIADATGGQAFYNTNGLARAEAMATEQGSVYYTLSYAPSDTRMDGRQRSLRITLRQPGYHLNYRQAYFADDLDNLARRAMDNPDDTLAATLQHGAPASQELFFEAQVSAQGVPAPATAQQMQELMKYEAMAQKKHGHVVQPGAPVLLQTYVVQFVLLPRQVEMNISDDGVHTDDLDFAVMSFDDDGLALNGIRTQLHDVIRPERWLLMQQGGYHIPMAFVVPVHARFLRLAVRDNGGHRTGSLEIPLPLSKEPTKEPAEQKGQ